MKILAGVYQPDSGELRVAGKEVTLHGPAAARAAGIAVIYQEPMLFPDLTVAENIFMGRQPVRAARRIDRGAMNREAARTRRCARRPSPTCWNASTSWTPPGRAT